MLNMGSWEGIWVVPGIAPLQTTQPCTTPGTPSPRHAGHGSTGARCTVQCPRSNMVVGLISVDQLSLSGLFSGIRGMTEVYNVVGIGDR